MNTSVSELDMLNLACFACKKINEKWAVVEFFARKGLPQLEAHLLIFKHQTAFGKIG
jgi:hypothetical protein